MKNRFSINELSTLAILVIMVLMGACAHKDDCPNYRLTPSRTITRLSDSIFLSGQVSCLDCSKKGIYLSDYNEGLFLINSDGQVIKHIAQKGRGFGEIGACGHFYVTESGDICVYDESEKSFDFYVDECWKTSIKSEQDYVLSSSTRFFSRCDSVWHSITHNEKTMAILSAGQALKQGKLVDGLDDIRRPTASERHVLKAEEGIILVGLGLPVVERYDDKGKRLSTYDLRNVPKLRAIYDAKKTDDPKSYFVVVADAYYSNHKLYLLTASDENDMYSCNTIYVLEDKDGCFELECSYTLSGNIYSTFCITEDNLCFAFNCIDSALEMYLLPINQ